MISNNSNKELYIKNNEGLSAKRKLISNIVELVKTYEIDGINVDFENMYKEDKNFFPDLL